MHRQTLSGFQLAPQQQRLWLLQQDSSVYCTQCVLRLAGELIPEALKAALQHVVKQHEILRTRFRCLPGMKFPVMVIEDHAAPSWSETDLSDWDSQTQADKIEALFQETRRQPFDFEQGPLLRLSLLRLSASQHVLLISLPALCADAWTLKNLVREISHCYAASLQAKNEDISDAAVVQYIQFAEWQNQLLAEAQAQAGKEYWRQQDLTSLANLRLPLEHKARGERGFEPDYITWSIASELTTKLDALAQKLDSSISIVLLACWQVLIGKLTGQTDVIIGTSCDHREYEELQDGLGLFATWLSIRCHLTPNLRFTDILDLVLASLQNAEEWQDYFALEPSGSADSSFFPIGFEFDQWTASHSAVGVSFSLAKQYVCLERFKVKLTCTRHYDSLSAALHYDTRSISPAAIAIMAEQFQTVLASAAECPNALISELEILSPTEQRLLAEWNSTQTRCANTMCVHQLFEQQAEQTPTNIAIVFEDQQLTYTELNARANQLAHYLQQLGVGPEVLVGLCLERSLDLIIGLLGILKAGGAYLPLDPAYPTERLTAVLRNAQVSVLLTQQQLADRVPVDPCQVVCLDTSWGSIAQMCSDPNSGATSKNLAYVIYTSGSTGQPKGVAVEHQQLCNYLHGIREKLHLPTDASFATVSTLAADLGNTAIFSALCTGGCLHVISPERAADPASLADYCRRHPIDCLKIVPSHLAALLESTCPEQILPRQQLILGGEASSWNLIAKLQALAPNCRILNHYGPTEATIGALTYSIRDTQVDDGANIVPLGRPIANTQVYVLDQYLHPVPIGVPGEVYIGGAGLARCYLRQPEQTAEKFIPNPFGREFGARLYKTGDLARYRIDGTIEFLGRTDDQVKVRGFRVELGEIAAVLSEHPGVQQAIVLAREAEPNDQRLVAYVVANQREAASANELRLWLRERLPDYMVPSAFVRLKAFPLTPNGKVDRLALPAPDDLRSHLETAYVAPCNEIEQAIATIWQEVLRLEKVGLHDNFFDLGGHSLLMVQVHSKLRHVFAKPLSIADLFAYPTVSTLANYFGQEQPEELAFQESYERAETRRASVRHQRQLRQSRRQANQEFQEYD